jgi:bacteriocin resistance YdeI/OmpD-like protein
MARAPFPTKQPMPGNVRSALEKRNLMDAYLARPAYQKDDYLKWIALAVGPAAKQKRLDQMLDELDKGGLFKGEPWTPPQK